MNFKKTFSLLSLIIANIIPIIGVWKYDWDFYNIFLLYWLESIVIAFFTIMKIFIFPGYFVPTLAKAPEDDKGAIPIEKAEKLISIVHKLDIHYKTSWIMGFLVTVGICVAISGYLLFSGSKNFFDGKIFTAFFFFLFSDAYIFYFEYVGQGEYKNMSPREFMFLPYKRFLIIFIVLIFGAILYRIFSSRSSILFLMAIIKTIFEIISLNLKREEINKPWIIHTE